MSHMKSGLLAAAALICIGVPSAQAQIAYGGGATFPSVVYRQLMDCVYTPADGAQGGPVGPMAPAADCPYVGGGGIGFPAQILYAPVGSGSGKRAFINNTASGSNGFGTPSASNSVPYTNSGPNGAYPYPYVTFIGSDDVWTTADQGLWDAANNTAKFGKPIMLPTLAGPVSIAFNGNDGNGNPLNINPSNFNPAGSTSQLNLSRQALCGIFSGHITKWDNPILTALNGGTPLGSGNITVVHRSDGSGTTFLLTNGLATQCQFVFGPQNETDATLVSYAFPWTERLSNNSTCSTTLPQPRGANSSNWPDLLNDHCGNAIANPGGGTFTSGSGNSGVVQRIQQVNGAIGYSTADFVQPVVPGGPATANLQSQWNISTNSTEFVAPTVAATQLAMASAIPTFDSNSRGNALAWSLQGVAPNPTLPGAYPLAGFTWMFMYQCYQVPTFNDAKTLVNIFLNFLFGAPEAQAIIQANGFATVPQVWVNEIAQLFNDPNLAPTHLGSGGCTAPGMLGARNE